MHRYVAVILAAVTFFTPAAFATGVPPIVLPHLGNAPVLYQPAPTDPTDRERYCTALALVHFHRLDYIQLMGMIAPPDNPFSVRREQALANLLRDDNRRGCSDHDRGQFQVFKSTVLTKLSDNLRARIAGQLYDNFMAIVTRNAPAEIMFTGLSAFFNFDKKTN